MPDAKQVLCRILGHKWVWRGAIRYEQGYTTACYVEASGDMVRVPVTWVCDEVCARCGGESWWPT